VSLSALLANKRIERHLTSANELAGLRKLIARHLADASVPGLSADRTFATAYNDVSSAVLSQALKQSGASRLLGGEFPYGQMLPRDERR